MSQIKLGWSLDWSQEVLRKNANMSVEQHAHKDKSRFKSNYGDL